MTSREALRLMGGVTREIDLAQMGAVRGDNSAVLISHDFGHATGRALGDAVQMPEGREFRNA